MSLRATIRDHLLSVWAGDPWYGSASKKILEDISAAEAAARPIVGVQTIWETTLHMVAWTEEATSRIRGNKAKAPDRGDWPTPADTSTEAWTAATDQLRSARYALLEAIEKAQEEQLYMLVGSHSEMGASDKVTRAQTASGLAEHDVYHLGQIALLKKALRAKA